MITSQNGGNSMNTVQTMLQDVLDGKRISKVLEVGAGRVDFISNRICCCI